MQKAISGTALNKIIIVAALGYFVDIYDLVLFSVERKDSLTEILGERATPENLKNIGMALLNCQMGGMLIGGLFWGILGDKKGRLSVLSVPSLCIRWRISSTAWSTLWNGTRHSASFPASVLQESLARALRW